MEFPDSHDYTTCHVCCSWENQGSLLEAICRKEVLNLVKMGEEPEIPQEQLLRYQATSQLYLIIPFIYNKIDIGTWGSMTREQRISWANGEILRLLCIEPRELVDINKYITIKHILLSRFDLEYYGCTKMLCALEHNGAPESELLRLKSQIPLIQGNLKMGLDLLMKNSRPTEGWETATILDKVESSIHAFDQCYIGPQE